ncbi:acid resistance repetitive basic protein Asr [Salmonella enterica subsp. enterica serovar Senftenberg]|nr:acid resistance repetitive basic protein Asr [Salmonella enterica subsp. enterica serovar Senftenberg]
MKKVLALVVAAAMGLSSAAFAAETATPAKTAAPAKTTQTTQHHKNSIKTVEQKAQAAKSTRKRW